MNVRDKIRSKALAIGFDACGIARCRPMEERRGDLQSWLARGNHGGLAYMQRHTGKRLDPGLLYEGAQSVVVCAAAYSPGATDNPVASRIASYAHARDYHLTIREKLSELLDTIRELAPGAEGRVFVDTAPILEKAWATEAGLGWIGRHSLLVHPRLGSFVMLGEIVTTAVIEPDTPSGRDGCGGCRACVDACPAGAILPGRTIDAGKCISRRTIERQAGDEGNLHGRLFGCDLCQQACPHNRKALVRDSRLLSPLPQFRQMTPNDWLSLGDAEFDRLFGQTPLSRCGLERIRARIRKTFG